MPVIRPTIITRIFNLLSLKSITSRLSSRSKVSPSGESKPMKREKPDAKPYLETRILQGARGDGNFMSTIDENSAENLSNMKSPHDNQASGQRHEGKSFFSSSGREKNGTTTGQSWFRRSFFGKWGGWLSTNNTSSTNSSNLPVTRHTKESSAGVTTSNTLSSYDGIGDGRDCQKQETHEPEKTANMV